MRNFKNDPVVALAVADIHLSLLPPVARAGEPDWFTAMARPIAELDELANEYKVPILCAGDIFHHWKAPPELINFAIDTLPFMIAIPGQHDLPLHSYDDIHKSAYATLMKAGKLANVKCGEPYRVEGGRGIPLLVSGFPWGSPVTPTKRQDSMMHIALHHAYRWVPGCSHPMAAAAERHNFNEYQNYNTVIVGDNHQSWDAGDTGSTYVFNCGSLMRRNADQQSHRPRIGMIRQSGAVVSHYLDCGADVLTTGDPGNAAGDGKLLHVDSLIDELQGLQGQELDFPETLRRAMNGSGISAAARNVLIKALENK